MPTGDAGLGTFVRGARRTVAIVLLGAAATAHGEPAYTITNLGTLGGMSSRAAALNNRGWVVGESETKSGETHAFLWTPESGMRDLGTLGGSSSRALAVNDRGVVAGESLAADGSTRAFLWSADEGMKPLAITTQTIFSCGFAVNEGDHVIGSLEERSAANAAHWHDSRVRNLPRLPGTGYIQPLDVNEHGDVVGQTQTASGDTFSSHAFYFRRALDAQNLSGFQLVSPESGSAAVAINDAGVAVGHLMLDGARVRAFRYTMRDGVSLLDDDEARLSEAVDINEHGDVAGSFVRSYDSDEAACVWRDGELLELNAATGNDSSWWLTQATAINDAGLVAGYGVHLEQERAFLLVPVAYAGAAVIRASPVE